MSESDEIADLLHEYREAIVKAAVLDPKVNRRWARKVIALSRQLRASDKGRSGIVALMEDPNPHVRVWAASDSLQSLPDRAKAVLVAVRDADGPGAFAAEWTLKEFEKGRLGFE